MSGGERSSYLTLVQLLSTLEVKDGDFKEVKRVPQPSPEALTLGDDDGGLLKGEGGICWGNWEFSKLKTGFPVFLGVQGERGCVTAGVF